MRLHSPLCGFSRVSYDAEIDHEETRSARTNRSKDAVNCSKGGTCFGYRATMRMSGIREIVTFMIELSEK